MKKAISAIEQIAPNQISLYQHENIEKEFPEQQDLMLISPDSWKKAIETHSLWLSNLPSVLIIRP